MFSMFSRLKTAFIALGLAVSLSACTATGGGLMGGNNGGPGRTSEVIGTVLGAGLGGLGGSFIGGGNGRTLAIIGGTVLGGFLGNQVGVSMDRADHMYTQQAMGNARVGQSVSWMNDSGHQVTMTPTMPAQPAIVGGQQRLCREATVNIVVNGRQEQGRTTACRDARGVWEIVGGNSR